MHRDTVFAPCTAPNVQVWQPPTCNHPFFCCEERGSPDKDATTLLSPALSLAFLILRRAFATFSCSAAKANMNHLENYPQLTTHNSRGKTKLLRRTVIPSKSQQTGGLPGALRYEIKEHLAGNHLVLCAGRFPTVPRARI